MRFSWIPLFLAVAFASLIVGVLVSRADDIVNFQPACKSQPVQNDPRAFTASCEIGPVGALRVSRVTYRHDGSQQPPAEATFLPFDLSNRRAAVLFVVDRSDRRRARTIALGGGDAVRMADTARAIGTYRFGFATVLGDRLDVMAPIGSQREDLARAAGAIRADGIGADSSRAVLDAIRLVAQTPADRHVIVLASDGKPEDKALASDDVIRAARDANVVVVGLGYRERTGDGQELASLKRLAEETGGFYAEPLLPATRIDDAVVARFGQFISSGGVATFPLDKSDPRGRYLISVEIEGGKPLVGSYVADISLPGLTAAKVQQVAAPTAPPSKSAPGPKPAANTPAQVLAVSTPSSPPQQPDPREPGSLQEIAGDVLDYALGVWSARPLTIIGATIVLALIAIGIIGMLARRARRIKVFAWIELLDQRRTRFPVTTPGVRLGRHSDNDIRFRDKSVHRYHAVLQRDPAAGTYRISDVSRNQARSNGVMVNGELVHNPVVLANGDTIELGDVSFRFVYT
jgi:hypothetical protein